MGKWPDLEAEENNCKIDRRSNWLPTSTKLIISEVRTYVVAHVTTDIADDSLVFTHMKRCELWNETVVRSVKQCEISYVLDGTEDDSVSKKWKSAPEQ
jgi:hypothetical protein